MTVTGTHICINWDSHLNSISKGFTYLQQNAEFVDMTLAAEGHLVKVHRNIVAVASPYIKCMLQSTPCEHPVIFLNNISHKILGYILEYIYSGEVKIPPDILNKFIEACKSLSIAGIDGITDPIFVPDNQTEPQVESFTKSEQNNVESCLMTDSIKPNYGLQVLPHENTVMSNDDKDHDYDNHYNVGHDNINPMDVTKSTNYDTTCNKELNMEDISNFIILKTKPWSQTATETDNTLKQVEDTKATHDMNGQNDEIMDTNNLQKIRILSDEIIVSQSSEIVPEVTLTDIADINNPTAIEIKLSSNVWNTDNSAKCNNEIFSTQPSFSVIDNSYLISSQNNSEENSDSAGSHSRTQCQSPPDVPSRKKTVKCIKKIMAQDVEQEHTDHQRPTDHVLYEPVVRRFSKSVKYEIDRTPHYSISTRGSIQLLLNRYIFHCHHKAGDSDRKKRWRCIAYRSMHCLAHVDTDGEDVTAMVQNHCHPDHDNLIRKKIKDKIVFPTQSNAYLIIEKYLMEEKEKNRMQEPKWKVTRTERALKRLVKQHE